jgi:Domain of unknown function (DUF4328)
VDDGTVAPENGADLPVAGWYPDLTNPGHERLWTGERWIAWIRPNQADKAEANPAGWRPDVGHPGFERLWSGEMWTDEIRRLGEATGPGPGVTAPEVATAGGAPAGIAPGATAPGVANAGGVAPGSVAATAAGPVLVPPPTTRSGAVYHDSAAPAKLATLGGVVQLAFAVTIVVEFVQLIANQRYIGLCNEILDGRLPTLSHVESIVDTLHTTWHVNLIVGGITGILFLAWFFRAYRNLVRAGIHDLRYGPGWALGAWFIPIFNLFRPKQIANDLWKGTASAATVGTARRNEIPLPAFLNWWWALWILGTFVGGVANSMVNNANAHEVFILTALRQERTGVWVFQVALVLLIVSAALALRFVRRVTQLQDANFRAPGRSLPSR